MSFVLFLIDIYAFRYLLSSQDGSFPLFSFVPTFFLKPYPHVQPTDVPLSPP